MGTPRLPHGLLGNPLGGSGPSLGGPWVTLGQPWGVRGALREHVWQTGGFPNRWFYRINAYIWALERGLGGTWGGEVEAKTGGEELSGDRGAPNDPKTKRNEQRRKRRDPSSARKPCQALTLPPPWAEM